MRLRQKPKEPKEKNFISFVEFKDYSTLGDFLAAITASVLQDIESLKIEEEDAGYWSENTPVGVRVPDKEAYEHALKLYQVALQRYSEWYKENKDEIEPEIEKRKLAAGVKKERLIKEKEALTEYNKKLNEIRKTK